MTELTTVVVFVKALVLPLGLGITALAYRAYRRSGTAAMRSFALGFGAVTAGAILGGGFDRILGIGLEVGLLVNGVLTAAGFAILGWSLYARDSSSNEPAVDVSSEG